MERKAIAEAARLLPPAAARDLLDLYHDYDTGTSPEAKLIKDLDKLDMCLQAYQYESDHPSIDLSEFYGGVSRKLHHPWAIRLLKCLLLRRRQHLSRPIPEQDPAAALGESSAVHGCTNRSDTTAQRRRTMGLCAAALVTVGGVCSFFTTSKQ